MLYRSDMLCALWMLPSLGSLARSVWFDDLKQRDPASTMIICAAFIQFIQELFTAFIILVVFNKCVDVHTPATLYSLP